MNNAARDLVGMFVHYAEQAGMTSEDIVRIGSGRPQDKFDVTITLGDLKEIIESGSKY